MTEKEGGSIHGQRDPIVGPMTVDEKPLIIQAPKEMLDVLRKTIKILPPPEGGVMFVPDDITITCGTADPLTGIVCNQPPHWGPRHSRTGEEADYNWEERAP